jgi:hypothetical protein
MHHAMRRAIVATALTLCASPIAAQDGPQIYGYFATRLEKSFQTPFDDNGRVGRENGVQEWSQPFFNVMMQHQFESRFKAFINLNGAGAGEIDVRNVWGEYSHSNAFNVRAGKIYRKFGLYNEILDAVPTYYGIEPPEAFDADHLLISRTTNLMVYGAVRAGEGRLNYAFTSDNGEGRDIEGNVPLGYDLNYNFGRGSYTLGVSGYLSNGATNGDREVGEGSPRSGVLPWMARDSFNVVNAYAEARTGAFTFQAEWAQANHKAERDVDAVLAVVEGGNLNPRQRARFLIDPNAAATASNVNTRGDYKVQLWYVRAGWSKETSKGEVGPYVQYDWYSNPETVGPKRVGGDAEAGNTDDGKFSKITAGVVFRPVPQVAFKVDGSVFQYRFLGERIAYPELRFDLSYAFGL